MFALRSPAILYTLAMLSLRCTIAIQINAVERTNETDESLCSSWPSGTKVDFWGAYGEGMLHKQLNERQNLQKQSHERLSDVIVYGQILRDATFGLAEQMRSKRAFVTMSTLCHSTSNTEPGFYLERSLTLARGLRKVHSEYPLIVLIVDHTDCDLAEEYSNFVSRPLNVAFVRVSPEILNVQLPKPTFENWQFTYPKTAIWAMEGFDRLAFLDGDVMVVQNIDDLFELPADKLHMGTDQRGCGAPTFGENSYGGASNLLVLTPSLSEFQKIHEEIEKLGVHGASDDDQKIISQIFADRLSILSPRNMLYMECFLKFDCNIAAVRAIHLGFAGRYVFQSRKLPSQIDADDTKSAILQAYSNLCSGWDVQDACRGYCPCRYTGMLRSIQKHNETER